MTEQKQHTNIYSALAAAQMEMEPARKTADNPHFKSKYADLSAVVDAVRPALNKHGIAFFHTALQSEFGHTMRTVLHHGESDTSIHCDVPLIIGRQDMPGYKSATTYAKRIGLESVTGVAPEDDDGNAAAESTRRAPADDRQMSWAETIIAELPETATEHDKADAITKAINAQWKRKKTAGELSNEWDRRAKLIANLRDRFPDMHASIVDGYENRMNDLTADVAAQ
ncbi:ERF superfamily protein [Roseivivax jejudonensis]|uniref:ERF superfamily protein n=1 Tax=Roseivivax jejudonensis TaxID=1529041 RepID=A0A1X7ABN4_9RHOB|nr:ERF family protein [Roseivivax jejudonensis]SLN74916.1 ERF superfamily protein [Roseivivax jejudonensis]